MHLDRQGVVRKARHRIGLPNMAQAVAAGLGVAFAIGGMEWSSLASHYPLALIPFATSIVLVIGSPEVEPAQPRALIGGHLVATLVGFVVLWLAGPQAWAAAAAVGLAVLAMYLTGTFHPPAGGSTRSWWSLAVFPGHSCSRRCLRARCRSRHSPMSGTAGSCAGRGRCAGYSGLPSLGWSCSANRSPSRVSTTLRRWNALSVLRWPIETTVVAGNFLLRRP